MEVLNFQSTSQRGDRQFTVSLKQDDVAQKTASYGSGTTHTLSRLLAGVLPEGYPDSVTHDYLEYQAWDTIQGVSSYVRSMISQEALLRGVGVGTVEASALSAAASFFCRDLSAMIAGLLFTYVQGSDLDAYAKQWRLAADCLNNVGMLLELLSPVFPSMFLILATAGAVARAITGVAGGATRTALTQHFCRGGVGSPADISAKEGSQESIATLLGMTLGMLVLWAAARAQAIAVIIFALLTVLHVYANVCALRALQMTTVNPYRLLMLVDAYMRTLHSSAALPLQLEADDAWQHVPSEQKSSPSASNSDSSVSGAGGAAARSAEATVRKAGGCGASDTQSLLSPAVIGKREPLIVPGLLRWLPFLGADRIFGAHVRLGGDLQSFVCDTGALRLLAPSGAGEADAWRCLAAQLERNGYAVVCHVRGGAEWRRHFCLEVVVRNGAGDGGTSNGCFAAAFWATVCERALPLKCVVATDAAGTGSKSFATMMDEAASLSKGGSVRDLGILLPEFDHVEYANFEEPDMWRRFVPSAAIVDIATWGWDCTRLRLKCHHTFRVETGDKKHL